MVLLSWVRKFLILILIFLLSIHAPEAVPMRGLTYK